MLSGSFTLDEILSQPLVWADTIDGFDARPLTAAWKAWQPSDVLVTGCGSAHYLSMSAAGLLRGVAHANALAHPASELVLAPELSLCRPEAAVLLAISRSGTTTETLAAVGAARAAGVQGVVVITCTPDSPLAEMADVVLAAPHAREESIAQTRSFSSMFLLAQAMAAAIATKDVSALKALPAKCQSQLEHHREPMRHLAGRLDLKQFFFLGSGVEYGLAAEAMLKLKEMSLTASEAYHVLEFRHGPMSMVDTTTAVVGLINERRAVAERRVLGEMSTLGAEIVDLQPQPDLEWWVAPLLLLPPLQLLAYERAIAKGLDPDKPRHLSAVIELAVI